MLTGLKHVDELLSPISKEWIVEFYGDPYLVSRLMHYVMAYRSRNDVVYVLFNQEFGGLDTLYFVKLCRMLDCRLENIVVSRSFRLNDTISALESLLKVENTVILLLYPYNYLPKDPVFYTEATRITGLISKLALSNQVLLFNTVSKYGRKMPEGGSLHHHLVKVIVRVERSGRTMHFKLVKHPVKPGGWRSIPLVLLEEPVVDYRRGKTIMDWITSTRRAFPI